MAQRSEIREQVRRLQHDLVQQGQRVRDMIELTVDAMFEKDEAKARQVIDRDDEVDRRDVEIERRAVDLLARIAQEGGIDQYEARLILTIVKVNNEYERIGDLAVYVSERINSLVALPGPPPPKFRVLVNSVIGIMGTTNAALEHLDTEAAQLVLASDDATEAFMHAIMRDVEEDLAQRELTVDAAFALNRAAVSFGRMADHCTNVAEQVIYAESNKIVRHRSDRWSKPAEIDT